MVKDGSKENRNWIAFSKLFLGYGKVVILLFSKQAFCGFLDAPFIRPFIATPIFTQMKAAAGGTYVMQVSFTSDLSFPKN